jgi:DNA polymerase sigma
MNLGGLLLDFLELYGFDFNYITAAISIRFDGRYFSKGSKDRKDVFWSATKTMSCGIENPLDKTMDVGKSTFRMHMIQRSFETAFRILLSRVSEPLPLIIAQKKMEEDVILDRGDGSILSSIIPPTEEMYQRAAKVRERYVSMNGSAMHSGNARGYASQMKSSRSEKPLSRSDSDMSVSSNEGNPRGRSRSDNTRRNNNSKRHRSESRDRGYMERQGDGQRRKSYR